MTRRMTVSDVAKAARVSAMTVSRVLNKPDSVHPQTRARVQAAIEQLGYVPNRAARSLTQRTLRLVALIVPDVTNPFFTDLARSVEGRCARQGYTLILGNTDEDRDIETRYLDVMIELGVDGVILAPCGNRSKMGAQKLNNRGIAYVLIDRVIPGVAADEVRGESYQASQRLSEHLLAHGRQRITMITGPQDVSTARERERGYRRAIRDAGLRPDVQRTVFTRDGGLDAGMTLLSRDPIPDAVFTANNFIAFGFLEAARRFGVRVPEDIALVTFDDVELTAEESFLTCAAQPAATIGETAASILLSRLAGDHAAARRVVLDTELVIRSSCGCDRPASGATERRPPGRAARLQDYRQPD